MKRVILLLCLVACGGDEERGDAAVFHPAVWCSELAHEYVERCEGNELRVASLCQSEIGMTDSGPFDLTAPVADINACAAAASAWLECTAIVLPAACEPVRALVVAARPAPL